MNYIDLRSDTVTKPTPEMREAMAAAEVGDDVYGEDPTVNRLQELSAEKTGHEAGLFVPTGTMGNLSAILAHCQRGDEVILGKSAHTYLYEAGGLSVLGGVHSCQLPNQPDGSLALDEIEAAIRPDDPHQPITRLITLENTHNHCGGTFQTVAYMHNISEFAHARGLKVHLDGARVFNAAAALNVAVNKLTSPMDSVTFCLSKGLSAPVGSVLCGSKIFIDRARRARKILGGGMRQAGVLAAAGIIAIDKMTSRLGEDHLRARVLAEGLTKIPGIELDEGTPATNMIFFNLTDEANMLANQLAKKLKDIGILVGVDGERRIRLVTHFWYKEDDVDKTVNAFNTILK
ncbi:MAG: low-specificity L-threonine aldolase [Anaerolineae bacterium]|nr:low-specificity L-threonine aldolase [Anaerolineae bacterium]